MHIPATPAELLRGGAGFLTEAFRSWGVLAAGDSVRRLTRFEEFSGGSTGRKALLSVEFSDSVDAPRELFAKFSRDLDNPDRDGGRTQMESEVLLASLSRTPAFPVAIPRPLFAAYHGGTGILITERIGYGTNGIEPAYAKCMDYILPQPLEHYEAMLTAVARLAGAHRAGLLPTDLVDALRPDMQQVSVGTRVAATPERLARRVTTLSDFVSAYPGLLPDNVRSSAFLRRLAIELPALHEAEPATWQELDQPDMVALCHWNANVDNAWFWRSDGVLQCGLLDWGSVGQMNIAMAIWGSLCSAETGLWDTHFESLLTLFVTEFHTAGGPLIDVDLLRRHVLLYATVMGITWLMDVPRYVATKAPAATTRLDPAIAEVEPVRCRLQMLTNLLNLWDTYDFRPHGA